jgi:CAAX prenyl protease-like protein
VEDPPHSPEKLTQRPELGYILPFAVFIALLAIGELVHIPQAARFITVLATLAIFSRGLLPLRPSRFFASALLGVGVFFIWVAPDLLIPGYRNFFLFSNSIIGLKTTTLPADQISPVFLVFRVLGSVITIPIIEELFWRGWMMRWIVAKDFTRIPIGTYDAEAFWMVAILFASEHGPYWDVGLVTGVIYNWWAIRTRNLTDCLIAHAVTNASLAIYVIGWGQWQYWL